MSAVVLALCVSV